MLFAAQRTRKKYCQKERCEIKFDWKNNIVFRETMSALKTDILSLRKIQEKYVKERPKEIQANEIVIDVSKII